MATVTLNATVDVGAVQKFLGALGDQLPRRVGFALNSTANDVQKAIQSGLSQSFTLRRKSFVTKTIYRKPSEDFPDIKAGRINAAVRIDERRDFLAKFEEGGRKTSGGGRLAVPVIRQARPTLVVTRRNKYHLGNLPSGLFRGNRNAKFFGAMGRHGTPVIFERTSKRRIKPIYALVKSVPIPASLRFHQTAQRIINSNFSGHVGRELAEAVRRAEQKGLVV